MDRRAFLQKALFATSACAAHSVPFLPSLRAQTFSAQTKLQPSMWSSDEITACWIGHSTVLLNVFGTIVLTDPVLCNDIGVQLLGSTIGIRRYTAPALRVEDIPRPDVILLSHAHMDHCDLPTLEALCSMYPHQIKCLCAVNTKDIIDDLPWSKCSEVEWWDTIRIGNIHITALEVLHNGWRYPWEPDRRQGATHGRSYNGYLISCCGSSVVFGGDTAFTESFRELRNINVDVAFMPIGAYQGCLDNHCTPEEAVRMSQMMNARTVAPIHCMTFRQSSEPREEPLHRFVTALPQNDIACAWRQIGGMVRIPKTVSPYMNIASE